MGGLPHLPITLLTLADPLAAKFTGGCCHLDVSALPVPRITGSRGGGLCSADVFAHTPQHSLLIL